VRDSHLGWNSGGIMPAYAANVSRAHLLPLYR
jgi:hypothetical protein